MGEPERFRVLMWQKVVPLIGLIVPAFFLVGSPAWQDAPRTVQGAVVVAAAAGVAWWIWRAWARSRVVLDDAGLTCWVAGVSLETWPVERLLNVKRYGKFRVRMCFDPEIEDQPDAHMHITLDLTEADAFVDALLDRYERATGRELVLADAA